MGLTYASSVYSLPPWETEPLCDSQAFRATVTAGLALLDSLDCTMRPLSVKNFLVLLFGIRFWLKPRAVDFVSRRGGMIASGK